MRYFCDTNDTSDTSNTAKSSDASKTNASVTRLSSYLTWKSSLKNSIEASAASVSQFFAHFGGFECLTRADVEYIY